MLSYFKRRANNRRDEFELAVLRIELEKINRVISIAETPAENLLFIALVGRQIRELLDHRFGWAPETSVQSEEENGSFHGRPAAMPMISRMT